MIYKLGYDYENTALLSIDGVELLKKIPALRPKFFATSKQKEWITPDASLYYSENYKGNANTAPDVSIWTTGVLTLNSKAYDTFHELLANAGEFLPISVYGETYYLFNTLYIIPDTAIDKSKAVEIIDTGVHFGQTNVVFDEIFLDSENILVFKSNTNKLLGSFCTEKFKYIYDSNNFKGIIFEPADVK